MFQALLAALPALGEAAAAAGGSEALAAAAPRAATFASSAGEAIQGSKGLQTASNVAQYMPSSKSGGRTRQEFDNGSMSTGGMY